MSRVVPSAGLKSKILDQDEDIRECMSYFSAAVIKLSERRVFSERVPENSLWQGGVAASCRPAAKAGCWEVPPSKQRVNHM